MQSYTDAPELVQQFLNYKISVQNRSKLTVMQYYHDLRTFFRFIVKTKYPAKFDGVNESEISFAEVSDKDITGITSMDIYEFLSYAANELDNKGDSRARKLSCLRSFYKYLTVTRNVIEDNPTQKIDSPKRNKKYPKFLSLDQSKQLLSAVDGKNKERDYAIITLFLNCGLRVSELAGINLSDIDSEMTTLYVTGKGSKQRILYLNDACRDALKSYLKVRPGNAKSKDADALFISRNHNRMSVKTVQYMIYQRLKQSDLGNLHMSVHKLRHTAATLMYKYGKTDVRVLKDILGHEEMSTTQIYTHVSDDQQKEAIDSNPLSHLKQNK